MLSRCALDVTVNWGAVHSVPNALFSIKGMPTPLRTPAGAILNTAFSNLEGLQFQAIENVLSCGFSTARFQSEGGKGGHLCF